MTDELPKVTIVIPVYNGSDFLRAAIDSALAQTYSNIEILIVNDGSDDNGATEAIALSYSQRIRYRYKPNGGVGSALNFAVREMTGDYFSWLSHDDLYAKTKIERQMQVMMKRTDKKLVLYSDYGVFSSSSDDLTPVALPPIAPAQFRYWITIQNSLHGCTLLVPRHAFVDCGSFNEFLRTTQDYDMWFRLAGSYNFVHMPEVLVYARAHPDQGTVKMGDLVKQECNELLTQFVDKLSPQELTLGSGLPEPSAYASLFHSFRVRGFQDAARRAQHHFLRRCFSANPLHVYNGLSVIFYVLRARSISLFKRAGRKTTLHSLRQKFGRAWAMGRKAPKKTVQSVTKLALKEKFSQVYKHNLFAGEKSRSGAGSDLVQTTIIRREIPRLLRDYTVHRFLDAPCGDWFWMREVELEVDRYIGVDIVDAIIKRNRSDFGRRDIEFRCLDISAAQLPQADLIFSRDCLVHLSYSDIFRILKNFKASGASYLLMTTFTNRSHNVDLGDGFWRPLNFQVEPFNFPSPLEIINEGCTEGNNEYTDKSLGLWKLEQINLA